MVNVKYQFNKKINITAFITVIILMVIFLMIGIGGILMYDKPEDRSWLYGFIITSILGTAALLWVLHRLYIFHKKRTSGEAALSIDYRGITYNTGIFGTRLIKWGDVAKITVLRQVNVRTNEINQKIETYTNANEIEARWDYYKESPLVYILVQVSNPEYYIRNAQGKEQKQMNSMYKRTGTPFEIQCGVIDGDKKELAMAVFNAYAEYSNQNFYNSN